MYALLVMGGRGGMYLHFHVTLAWLIDWVLVVASKDWLATTIDVAEALP